MKRKVWSIYRGKKVVNKTVPEEIQMLGLLDKDFK